MEMNPRLYLLFLSVISGATAYKSGAGDSACLSLTPGHGATPQRSQSPYTIVTNASEYMAGGSLVGMCRIPLLNKYL